MLYLPRYLSAVSYHGNFLLALPSRLALFLVPRFAYPACPPINVPSQFVAVYGWARRTFQWSHFLFVFLHGTIYRTLWTISFLICCLHGGLWVAAILCLLFSMEGFIWLFGQCRFLLVSLDGVVWTTFGRYGYAYYVHFLDCTISIMSSVATHVY